METLSDGDLYLLWREYRYWEEHGSLPALSLVDDLIDKKFPGLKQIPRALALVEAFSKVTAEIAHRYMIMTGRVDACQY